MRVAVWGLVLGVAALVPGGPAVTQSGTDRGACVTHYDLTLDLPVHGSRIDARAVLDVRREAHIDTLALDLVGLAVDSVLVNGAATEFGVTPGRLAVPLPPGADDSLVVAIRYHGSPTDGLIVGDTLGRWTAFGDNWPERARYWIPSIDEPSDKATVDWTITAPSDRSVVANGSLVESVPLGAGADGVARTRWHWRETKPVPTYVMVVAVGPLAYADLGHSACGRSEAGGCVHQMAYVFPDAVARLPGPFARVGRIVGFFSSLIAPFPWERLAHVESATRFGGMENATEIFYPGRAVSNGTLSEETVAHETAHQWFGDAVTERTFADLWLSEGFATYWAALWDRYADGDSVFRADMARMRRQVIASSVSASRPVHDSLETNMLALLNTNSYQKGAWVLHMLRAELGDSAFFRGLRRYYLAHRYGNAQTGDLERALERTSGDHLDWFFDQWIRRPGWIEAATSWRYDAQSHRVTLYVEQGERFAPYRFPLVVDVGSAAGTRRVTVMVAAVHSQRLVLPISFDASPRTLVVDPDGDLLAAFTPR